MDDIRGLERVAQRAWPPQHIHDLDGWQIRYTPDVPRRRSNSVATLSHTGEFTRSIAAVERFYAERGLDPRFHITPASEPHGLDDELAQRRYALESPTIVMSGPLIARGVDGSVVLSGCADDRWLDTWSTTEDRGTTATRAIILDRIESDHRFALASDDGRPVGVALGVLDGRWLGIFSVAVIEPARRRGHGAALVNALASWALAGGADRVYLQVEEANAAGHRLFGALGSVETYRYHYRRLKTRAAVVS